MKISFYVPTYEDLWFRKSLMADEKTMSYNHNYGGTIDFPENKWKSFYENCILCDDSLFYYAYLRKDDTGEFVGDVGYRYDKDRNIYIVHLLILNDFRKNGYGSIALKLLFKKVKEHNIKFLHDDIAIDNTSVNLFIKNGFVEEYRTSEYIMLKKEIDDW